MLFTALLINVTGRDVNFYKCLTMIVITIEQIIRKHTYLLHKS